MKKIISLVLAAVLTLSLAACGTKNDSKGDQPAAPQPARRVGGGHFQRQPALVPQQLAGVAGGVGLLKAAAGFALRVQRLIAKQGHLRRFPSFAVR